MTKPRPKAGSTNGPTALRMLLGAHLRRLREAQGITRHTAGYRIRGSDSKISRMELGRVGFKERDVQDLLDFYHVTDEAERDRLLALAREANNPGWWHRFGDVLPGWFQAYVDLESTAQLIRSYEIQFVPGLLQTRRYAAEIVREGNRTASRSEIEHRVELRVSRQEMLLGERGPNTPRAPNFWAVIDEGALRRRIGGTEVMREQLHHLIEVAQRDNVMLQIMPFSVGSHTYTNGAFSILRFPDADLPDIVYLEQLLSAVYLDKREEVDQYIHAMELLCVQAEAPNKTVGILEGILKDMEDAS